MAAKKRKRRIKHMGMYDDFADYNRDKKEAKEYPTDTVKPTVKEAMPATPKGYSETPAKAPFQ